MEKHWTRTIPMGLAAAVVVLSTMDVRATVVFSQSDLGGLEKSDVALVDDSGFAELVHETMLGQLSDNFQLNDPTIERTKSPEIAPALTPLSNMSPPPSSVVGGVSGAGGYALVGEPAIPTIPDLQGALTPEARLLLPTGPPYRWFRPPRG